MGTMDIISLDDTADNDASLFVLDESPMPVIMEEVTNKQTQGRKRKSNNKKNNSPQKKKKNLDFTAISNAQWIVIGSRSNDSQQTENNSKTNSSKTPTDSRSSFLLSQSNSRTSSRSEKCKNGSLETIVIASDDEDSVEAMDVIELSDEEVGVIGGELSTTVSKAQKHLSEFQRRGRKIKKPWHKSPQKFSSPPSAQSSTTDKAGGPARSLRPIVIDGSNVAFGHGARAAFSSKGLEICCDYFLKRGHTVKVFVPQFRRRHRATCDTHILDKLEKERILIFTPSRMVNGKQVVSYDDRYIVEYATKCGGIIVSRDNFQDLITENHEWKETIDKRLLMYTWVDDMIMFPKDPLGRNGPSLDEFLSFPPENSKDITKSSEVTVDK